MTCTFKNKKKSEKRIIKKKKKYISDASFLQAKFVSINWIKSVSET